MKKIMKMDPNITDNITVESNYLVCAATELFVKFLAKNVHAMDSRCLSYENLAKFVQEDEKMDFLVRKLPTKQLTILISSVLARHIAQQNHCSRIQKDSRGRNGETRLARLRLRYQHQF